MVELGRVWQNIVFAMFLAIWFAGGAVLYLRLFAKQGAYLRRFPPVRGVPLDTLPSGNPFGARSRATFGAMLQRQADPELERQRRDLRRPHRYFLLWIFGFPILFMGTAALLIVTGVLRLVH